MLQRILAGSRYFVLIAVIGSFLASIAMLIYGSLAVVGIIGGMLGHGMPDTNETKYLAIEFIEVIDSFLLGTVLYIIALGLYSLFIDHSLPMPGWFHIASIEQLKEKLLGTIIVMLAVTFLGNVVEWEGKNIMTLGIAVGLVLGALALIQAISAWHDKLDKPNE